LESASGSPGVTLDRVTPVITAIRTRKRFAYLANAGVNGEEVVPLYPTHRAKRHLASELATLQILCRVLADRREVRPRLLETNRMNKLLAEIATGATSEVTDKLHLRRSNVEIRTAMYSLGLVHRYGGRPLHDGESVWTADQATDAVIGSVVSNRYSTGVAVSREQILSVLDKEYFSIRPWPLSSLFDCAPGNPPSGTSRFE
jgi:hypothetical protein